MLVLAKLDADGRLLAQPDLNLISRRTDMTSLP
jgi:hypothetical protein